MILVAFGTRPEIIKLFPVIHACKRQHIPIQTVFTGQHLDLYEDVSQLIPEPDHRFDIYANGPKNMTLGESFTKICQEAEKLFREHSFSCVVVQGDTTTAWALAQIAFFNNIRVAHVEAGLRTHDLHNPFPEELNRTLISQVATFNFAPTELAYQNLQNCGAKNVFLVGNTIVDAVHEFQRRLITPPSTKKVLVTLHRRENHKIMPDLFDELQSIATKHPQLEFVFPIHPNPNVIRHRARLQAHNIKVVKPVGYMEMLQLITESKFIISDSGGIQEEATCLNKKILIVRETTERQETIEVGLGKLVGRNISKFIDWALTPPPEQHKSPYGGGDSATQIAKLLKQHLYAGHTD